NGNFAKLYRRHDAPEQREYSVRAARPRQALGHMTLDAKTRQRPGFPPSAVAFQPIHPIQPMNYVGAQHAAPLRSSVQPCNRPLPPSTAFYRLLPPSTAFYRLLPPSTALSSPPPLPPGTDSAPHPVRARAAAAAAGTLPAARSRCRDTDRCRSPPG